MTSLPSALAEKENIKSQLADKKPAVFLDYDGTLTPIVAKPELAVLSEKMRSIVQDLSKRCVVGIISGRKREDVESLVQIPGLYYAGSHGFDIKGPDLAMTPQEVLPLLPIIERVSNQLTEMTKDIEGCLIENKKYAIAIHFRLVDPKHLDRIEKLVDAFAEQEEGLRKTTGKMIFELRANIPWDKGKALLHLLQALHLKGPEVIPFYLGDDDTDEDAFAVLQDKGFGILVSETPQNSAAKYSLKDAKEVESFLENLAQLT